MGKLDMFQAETAVTEALCLAWLGGVVHPLPIVQLQLLLLLVSATTIWYWCFWSKYCMCSTYRCPHMIVASIDLGLSSNAIWGYGRKLQ